MDRSRKVGLFVLTGTLALGGSLARVSAERAWLRMHHAVVPNGSSQMGFGGKPALILSMVGQRAGMEEQDRSGVGAYHVLLLFPGDSVHTPRGSAGSDGFTGQMSEVLELWSGGRMTSRRTFVSEYDPLRGRAHIGGHTFRLSRGNLFVVRYDARGGSSVIQLPHSMLAKDPDSLVRAFRALVPGDPVLRDLDRYPWPPCPRAPATAAGAAT